MSGNRGCCILEEHQQLQTLRIGNTFSHHGNGEDRRPVSLCFHSSASFQGCPKMVTKCRSLPTILISFGVSSFPASISHNHLSSKLFWQADRDWASDYHRSVSSQYFGGALPWRNPADFLSAHNRNSNLQAEFCCLHLLTIIICC